MRKRQNLSVFVSVASLLKTLAHKCFRVLGYECRKISSETDSFLSPPDDCITYLEREEAGPKNLEVKLQRQAEGGPFEWPNIVALNHTVATLIGDSKNIVELGGGTGCFALEAALNSSRKIVCSEFNKKASEWAQRNRNRPNIKYVVGLPQCERQFELTVSIEVIEHVADYSEFLRTCCKLAPKAIITTPNKNRSKRAAVAMPPAYEQHVREWTAGEFYWVLKVFYSNVALFGMPDSTKVGCIPMRVTDHLSPLIAVCTNARTVR